MVFTSLSVLQLWFISVNSLLFCQNFDLAKHVLFQLPNSTVIEIVYVKKVIVIYHEIILLLI